MKIIDSCLSFAKILSIWERLRISQKNIDIW
jgi:hypothetical protein